jgi:hypothetical protein
MTGLIKSVAADLDETGKDVVKVALGIISRKDLVRGFGVLQNYVRYSL